MMSPVPVSDIVFQEANGNREQHVCNVVLFFGAGAASGLACWW